MRSTQTLGELITQAARETGADESFVRHVEALFVGRDIGLEAAAAPWAVLVRETFERHVELSHTLARVRQGLALLDELHGTLQERTGRLQVQVVRLHRTLVELRERVHHLQEGPACPGGAGASGWLN